MNVVTLQETNFRNIPATLRNIAKEIELGCYGDVKDACLILDGTHIDVFHAGGGDVGDAVLLMNIGIAKLANACLAAKP